jgi:hypothetical protein
MTCVVCAVCQDFKWVHAATCASWRETYPLAKCDCAHPACPACTVTQPTNEADVVGMLEKIAHKHSDTLVLSSARYIGNGASSALTGLMALVEAMAERHTETSTAAQRWLEQNTAPTMVTHRAEDEPTVGPPAVVLRRALWVTFPERQESTARLPNYSLAVKSWSSGTVSATEFWCVGDDSGLTVQGFTDRTDPATREKVMRIAEAVAHVLNSTEE